MEHCTVKEQRLLKKQWKQLDRREKKAFGRETHSKPWDKLMEKVPLEVEKTFQEAFGKGFRIIFSKGSPWVEKTCRPAKAMEQAQKMQTLLRQRICRANIRNIDKTARNKTLLNQGIVLAEGTFLGLAGIGLPDIPIFLAMVLRTVYEIAFSYGFHCQNPEEQLFCLALLCTAATTGEQQREYAAQADAIAWRIDKKYPLDMSLEEKIEETSRLLAACVTSTKVVQGIFLIGAAGGPASCLFLNRVAKTARLKYKKRLLHKLSPTDIGCIL